MYRSSLACIVGALLPFFSGLAQAEPAAPITLLYYERPPLQFTQRGLAAGLVIAPVSKALAKADIPFQWKLTTTNRIMDALKSNKEDICTSGWFITDERKKFVNYTLPIYRDLPMMGLTRLDLKLPENIPAKELFSRPDISLILKQGFVYGRPLDDLIATVPASRIVWTSNEVPEIARMVGGAQSHVTIVAQEEADILVKAALLTDRQLKTVTLTDIHAGDTRHVMCSKRVPRKVIERIDEAIRQTVELRR